MTEPTSPPRRPAHRREAAPARTRKAWLIGSAKLAVSIILLVLLARSLDLAAVFATLDRVPLPAIVAAVALFLAQTVVLGLRWWLVIGAVGPALGFGLVSRLMFIGVFFNQVLPTSFGGDAIRIWQATRSGLRYDAAINGVLIERVSGVLGLVVLVALGVSYLGPRLANQTLRYVLLASLPATLVAIAALASLDRMPAAWRGRPVLRELAGLAAAARRIFLEPTLAVMLLLLSMLSHSLAALAVFAFAAGLGLALSPWDCLALVPSVILIMLIPVTFAGWGVREAAMVGLFAFIGVSEHTALALSLAFGLAMIAAGVPGCLLWLAWRGPSPAGGKA